MIYEIAVITRIPDPLTEGGGNLYHLPPVYYENQEGTWDPTFTEYTPAVVKNFWDRLIEDGYPVADLLPMGPLFELGHIYYLNEWGRCIVTGYKPSKWDVDYEVVNTLDEAIALSRKVQGYNDGPEQA